jgi:hypothetical protein
VRRKDREITDRALIERIMEKASVCRIAVSENDRPYIIPMNFGYQDNCLYLHSAGEGKKIDIIKKNRNICFEMEAECEFVKAEKPCDWSMKYYSVVGFGKAFLADGYEQKRKGLDAIVKKYTGKPYSEYPEAVLEKLAVIRVEIDSITGKKSDG